VYWVQNLYDGRYLDTFRYTQRKRKSEPFISKLKRFSL
jgi:hypothetical protein